MCVLKNYNDLFLRRYLLEKYNLGNLNSLLNIKMIEFRVRINLKYLSVLKFLELLSKFERVIGIKLNYRVLGDNDVEIYGYLNKYRIWKFLNSFYNYDYIVSIKEIEVLKFGLNKGKVIDLGLKNFVGTEIPMRLKLSLKLRDEIGKDLCDSELRSLVLMSFCSLGFYKDEI